MSINWYPGHMHKAQKEIKKRLPDVDMFIEVLDARIPYSSQNPMLADIRHNKPCIKILNKADLADSKKTAQWQAYLEQKNNTKTLALNLHDTDKSQQIFSLCQKFIPNKGTKISPITCLITGIPNVGKSTLINILASRTIAKTGNEPAVTQTQQRIDLGNNIILFDTPGLLWPKVENEDSGYRLAVTGAIKDTAFDYIDIAYYAADFMLINYLDTLVERYDLEETPRDATALLEAIGRKRGALVSGGRINLNRTSAIFIQDIRSGTLGEITFETPLVIEAEVALTEKRIADKLAAKVNRKKNWKNKR
ncbi:MAG: ribosome biogenesis GTPase YlqF [Cycloclasticus sp.]|nr:ribosome biogenesis GTPase YlqF [Cycloclasticus sp.]